MEKLRVFSSKMVMSVIVTALYRFETPLKTDSCFHSYIAYDTAVGAARMESYRHLQSLFVGQYHTGCPTRYRTRHEYIATKFEQEYVRCVRNEEECVCSVCLQCA